MSSRRLQYVFSVTIFCFPRSVFWKSFLKINKDMSKSITDYLKRSCSAPLSTEEPSSLSTVKTSSSQRTESDVQSSRTIHINEEKSTDENNESIPVQCQPGPDYSFPMKQFGKKKRSCQASWFKNFSWFHYSKEK